MTKRRLEQLLYLAVALVCADTPLGLDPVVAGLLLAALNLALALCV
jgi:hypothetical protein